MPAAADPPPVSWGPSWAFAAGAGVAVLTHHAHGAGLRAVAGARHGLDRAVPAAARPASGLVGPRDPVRCPALGAADADGQSVSTVTMPFPVVAVILRGDDGSVGTVTCFMPAPVRARTS